MLAPGSISLAVDRLEKKALVTRKNTDDRRVRVVELAEAMEQAASELSTEEGLMLLRLPEETGKSR